MFGTEATFIYDDAGPRLHLSRDPAVTAGPVTMSALPADKGDLLPDFVTAILNEEDTAAETQLVFHGCSISIACEKALQSRAIEEIEYV